MPPSCSARAAAGASSGDTGLPRSWAISSMLGFISVGHAFTPADSSALLLSSSTGTFALRAASTMRAYVSVGTPRGTLPDIVTMSQRPSRPA